MNAVLPFEQKKSLSALAIASFDDVATWAEAHTMFEFYLRKCVILSNCENPFWITQIGNRFEVHSNITMSANTNLDLLNLRNSKNPAHNVLLAFMRLYEVLKPYCDLVERSVFDIDEIKEQRQQLFSSIKIYERINAVLTVNIKPLVLELTHEGYQKILDKAVKRHHNPLFISSSNFVYKSVANEEKSEFHITFDYQNQQIVGEAFINDSEKYPFYLDTHYKDKAFHLFKMGMIGNIATLVHAPSNELYLSPYPNFKYCEEEITVSIKQFVYYEAQIKDPDGEALTFKATEIRHSLFNSVGIPSHLGYCFEIRPNFKELENPSKPVLDKLVKSGLKEGFKFVDSTFKSKRHNIRCIDDVHFKTISFSIASCRNTNGKLITLNRDGSLVLVTIKLKSLTKQFDEILVTAPNGDLLEGTEIEMLKNCLAQGSHLYGRINKTQSAYLVKQQLAKSYTLLSEIYFE